MKALVPQKRVAADLGVSRSSLWRASRSAIPGFPAPVIVRARVYWREADLPALKAALERFEGRTAFERARRFAKACAAREDAAGAKPKRGKGTGPARHPDLFGEAAAPQGGEKSSST